MSDDNFSGLIRSGATHSVSVSKHTGNAKNPKNIFNSVVEDETLKKTAPKKHHAVESNANIQPVNSGESETNVQLFEIEEVAENVQHVGIGVTAPNLQELANSKGTPLNRQVVINESLSDNIQKLGQDNMSANMAQVPIGKSFTGNVQAIPVEEVAANHQVINQAGMDTNQQTISLDVDANNQVVGQGPFNRNSQNLESFVPAVNMQSAPDDGPAGVNRQATNNKNLKDHFAVLPSSKLARARVNFGDSSSLSSGGSEQSPSKGDAKQDVKPVNLKAPSTAQQVTKNKRDAFLGRLAGIKRDVGSITLKLDAMENGT